MQHVQRHWRPIAAVFALLVLTGTLLLRDGDRAGAAAIVQDPPFALMDGVARDSALTLLDEMSLDRHVLTAMNLSGVQAVDVLAEVRSASETNAAALTTLRNNIHAAKAEVRSVERAIRMGPLDASHAGQLSTAQQSLATAQAAYRSQVATFEADVTALLSTSQQSVWSAMRGGYGNSALRMVILTDSQRADLAQARRHFKWSRAAARTDAARDAATAAWDTAVAAILTNDQLQVVNAFDGYAEAAGQAVRVAFETVLPEADAGV